VNRGWACTAKACPPINRYRVPVEVSTRKNSFQSSFRCKVSEPRLAEPLDRREAFFRGRFLEVGEVETVCFCEARDPDDPLNGHLHPPTVPSAAAASSLNVALTRLESPVATQKEGRPRFPEALSGPVLPIPPCA